MRLTLKNKITGLAIFAAILPVLIILVLTLQFEESVVESAEKELTELGKSNTNQIAKDIYKLCETTNEFLKNKLELSLSYARDLSHQSGSFTLSSEKTVWQAKNQLSEEVIEVSLPKMMLGSSWLGMNYDLSKKTPVVDDVGRITGSTCTIFQRINERGDMLRVATNVETNAKKRAIGTYIPAVQQDNSPNPVIASVVGGRKSYKGIALVVKDWYLTIYEPIFNSAGDVVGMLYVGEKLDANKTLHQAISNIVVGKTGYVYVLGAKGARKGVYIVSKDGLRDGENIYNSQDASGHYFIRSIVDNAVRLKGDEVHVEPYSWQNLGEESPRAKFVSAVYFEPWDWIIGASSYEDDFHEVKENLDTAINSLVVKLFITGIIVVALFVALSFIFGSRLAKPLEFVNAKAKIIASGNIFASKEGLDVYLSKIKNRRSKRTAIKNIDESLELVESFSSMADQLGSLIGQVQRSGIQVTTSATEISASARSLEATVAEQAASIREVTATSKEISSTAEDLAQTMENVGESVADTANTAETGKNNLIRMENAMQALTRATASISAKLGIINDKANKISGVITTINKISDQTNLLSLNAAIEAEKAGEYGKGFSVVAREISRLADQTAIATQDIEYMVIEMQSSVSSGVMEMDRFGEEVRSGASEIASIGDNLSRIIESVNKITPRFNAVDQGMQAQAAGAMQISEAMAQLSIVAERTKESLIEFKRATELLNEAVHSLQQEVTKFRIKN